MKIAIISQEGKRCGYPVAAQSIYNALSEMYRGHVDMIKHGGMPHFYHLAIHVIPFFVTPKLLPCCRNVIYTMTESSEYPSSAYETLSQYDAVATPAAFSRDALARIGINAIVAHLGFDRQIWPTCTPRKPADRPYRVLCVAHSSRKAGEIFAEGFFRAFDGDSQVQGVIKSNIWTRTPGIEVVNNATTLAEHQALIDSCDMAVVCALGEGASLMPLEFLSRGLVTIVADNTAHLDYPDDMYWRLRKQTPIPAKMYKSFYAGDFFRSDPAELADMMIDLRQRHQAGELQVEIERQQQYLDRYDSRTTAANLVKQVMQ